MNWCCEGAWRQAPGRNPSTEGRLEARQLQGTYVQ